MATPDRFRCPSCGFAVFNRRVSTCEACGIELPASMRFSAKDLALIQDEEARNLRIRKELAREAEALEAEKERRRGSGG